MKMQRLAALFSLAGFLGIEAQAGVVIEGPSDIATITNVQEEGRILFHLPLDPLVENARIERATLLLALSGQPSDKILTLQIHPIMSPWDAGTVTWDSWNTPGGDIEKEIYARAEVGSLHGERGIRIRRHAPHERSHGRWIGGARIPCDGASI